MKPLANLTDNRALDAQKEQTCSVNTISIMFTLLSVCSFILSIFLIPPSLNIFVANGMPVLPIWWFLSVGFVITASLLQWVSPRPMIWLWVIQFSIFVVDLWIFPHIVGLVPGAGQGWQYSFWGQVAYISKFGRVNSNAWVGQNWPIPSIIWVSLSKIIGINDPEFFVSSATWFVRILSLLPIYFLLRVLLQNSKKQFAGMYIYVVGLWSTQIGFTMQALGYLFYLFLFALAIYIIDKRRNNTLRSNIISIIMGLVVIFTHLLSALWSMMAVFIPTILNKNKLEKIIPVLILALFFGIWFLYYSYIYATENLRYALSNIFSLSFVGDFANQVYNTPSNTANTLATMMKTSLTLSLVFFAITFYVIRWFKRIKFTHDYILFGVCIALGLIAAAVGTMYSPLAAFRWEIFNRLFLFLLPIVSYFIVTGINSKIFFIFLAILLIIWAPLSYCSHFAPEYNSYINSSTVQSYEFIGEHVINSNVFTLGNGVSGFELTEDQFQWVNNYDLSAYSQTGITNIIAIGSQDRRLSQLMNEPLLTQELETRLNSDYNASEVYDNGSDIIFSEGN